MDGSINGVRLVTEPKAGVEAVRASLATGLPLGLDIETRDREEKGSGLNPRKGGLVSIQFGSLGSIFVCDVRKDGPEAWGEAVALLLQKAPVLIGHNLAFDLGWLYTLYGLLPARVHDTMIQAQLIAGRYSFRGERIRFDLASVASRNGLEVSKRERAAFIALGEEEELAPELLAYAGKDVEVTLQIDRKQWPELVKAGLVEVAALENAAVPAIARMNATGMYLDREAWGREVNSLTDLEARLREELAQELGPVYLESLEEEARRTAGKVRGGQAALDIEAGGVPIAVDPSISRAIASYHKAGFNPGSPKQLAAALYALGVPVSSTGKGELEEYSDIPEVAKVLQWRKVSKLVSSFGPTLLEKVEASGRVYPSFMQLGAETGRLSCNNPNLQQIPARQTVGEALRGFLTAEPGNVLLVSDYSQIESRILADWSGDPNMLALFESGEDLYSGTARLMFHLGAEVNPKKAEYKPGLTYRQVAKSITLGLAYGMSPAGLAAQLGVGEEEAGELQETYFSRFPGVRGFLEELAERAVTSGESRTYAGRRRLFDTRGESKGAVQRKGKNSPIQGTNADIMKLALALLNARLSPRVRLVATVHDELIIEAPEELAEEAGEVLGRSMGEAARVYLTKVKLPAMDVRKVRSWAEAKD